MNRIILSLDSIVKESQYSFEDIVGITKIFYNVDLSEKETQSLVSKGLITPEKTWTGDGIGALYDLQKSLIESTNAQFDLDFEKWWNSYPLSDGHAHFAMTRGLRLNKSKCRELYQQTLVKESIHPDELLEALEKEVRSKKLTSVQRNNMTYMVSSVRYLEEGHYSAWLTDDSNTTSPQFTGYNKSIL